VRASEIVPFEMARAGCIRGSPMVATKITERPALTAGMRASTIHVEAGLATAVVELARLARVAPDLYALGLHADAASRAFDELAAGLDKLVAVPSGF